MPSAMAVLRVPVPNTVMNTSAKITPGNAICASMMRMITSSTAPPTYPATAPSNSPTVSPMPTEDAPTKNAACEPFITRLKISRPKLSVPSRCAALGG